MGNKAPTLERNQQTSPGLGRDEEFPLRTVIQVVGGQSLALMDVKACTPPHSSLSSISAKAEGLLHFSKSHSITFYFRK